MGKCALCGCESEKDSLLCASCNFDRMQAASCARIMAGTGVTYSNARAFSEGKWIKMCKEDAE